jgi:hypothetical protein
MQLMFDFSGILMEKLVIHRVGNRLREEGIVVAPDIYKLTDGNVEELLLKYFLSPFKEKVCYKFCHDTDIHLNELYMYTRSIFINPQTFYEQSVNILKHLYEKSDHPQIKDGEFYMTYFSNCIINGENVDAVGIFKTEKKESYLKITNRRSEFMLDAERGINTKKLDKGCIVFNMAAPDGYRVAIVDSVNKSNDEAAYWKEEFLRLTHVEDAYFHTQNHLDLCRDFAENIYGPLHHADKKDQVVFMNEAIAYFDKNEKFQLDSFVQSVVKEPELIEQFKDHKQMYETNQGLEPAEDFNISGQAVKSVKRKFKNLIKLDTDFEIKVKPSLTEKGDVEFIERGYDEQKGMHFYKVYFNTEE